MNKGILSNMSSWLQLLFLAMFSFGGLIFTLLIVTLISGGSPEKIQSIDFLRIAQLIQASCVFLIPACLCAFLFFQKPSTYLKINKPINFKFLLYSLLLIFAIQPFISLTAYYNNMIAFPESLSWLEKTMREMEESANALIEKMLITDSIGILFFNIFIVAIMAGITEEFFFRGAMQQIFKSIVKNPHIAIWITAFVFSFIHFQFYGFIPRLLLGAVLGYIFLWAGNLWIPVIVHAFNNLISVLMFHFYHDTPIYEQMETMGAGENVWLALVSAIISVSILFLLSKEYVKNNSEELIL